MNTKPPTIGRIVIFTPASAYLDRERFPGIIHRVYTDHVRKELDCVDITLFTSQGVQYRTGVKWAKFTTLSECGNSWDWPERVPDRPAVETAGGTLVTEDEEFQDNSAKEPIQSADGAAPPDGPVEVHADKGN